MEIKRSQGTNHSHNEVPYQLNVLEFHSTSKAPPTLLARLEAQIVQHKSNLAIPFSLEQIQQALQSEQWEVRSAAIERLSTQEHTEVFALLAQAFHDEHRLVRMAALRGLAQKEDTALSTPMLERGLHDDDWQVREVATQVLGSLGTPICLELVRTALHDENTEVRDAAQLILHQYEGQQALSTQTDSENQSLLQTDGLQMIPHDSDVSVRDAAGLTPQQNSTHTEAPILYGRLWEKKAMHDQLYDTKLSKRNGSKSAPEVPLPASLQGALREYSGNSYGSHLVQEQMQGYALREHAVHDQPLQDATPSDEYNDGTSSSREKITNYSLRSKSRKRWWVLVASVAVLFFMLGHFATLLVPQFGLPVSSIKSHIATNTAPAPTAIPPSNINPSAPTAPPLYASYANSPYALNKIDAAVIIQNELAAGLHLAPDQLIKQIKQHGTLAALAVVQGISEAQLKAIELATAQDAFDGTFIREFDGSPEASNFKQHLQHDQLFLVNVLDNALAICANDYCTTTGN